MFNIRLRVDRYKDTIYIDMMREASKISMSSASLDYKVESGNRIQGILKGIGLQSAGRTATFTIPIFEQQAIADRKDINQIISFYNTLLSGTLNYKYYVEIQVDDEWYSCECKITKNTNLDIEYVNLAKSFGITATFIDNYYYSNEYKEVELDINKTSGLQNVDYEAETDTLTLLNAEITTTSATINNNNIFLYVNSNYGISFNDIGVDTDNNYSIYDNIVKRDDLVINYTGIQPYLYPGGNTITIYSKHQLESFKIIYKKGLLL